MFDPTAHPATFPAPFLVEWQVKAAMKNMSTLYQHRRSQSWSPHVSNAQSNRLRRRVASVGFRAKDGQGDTIHIDYDGGYNTRALLHSGPEAERSMARKHGNMTALRPGPRRGGG
jgi:hypothetical protein